ncbi:dTMP kinase [Methanolobus sediminis]|uniref:Probable thymidylate kinase n=1 Tax=Methanolobus sediminis TaxID=3072978 RepID=A0AA51UMP2_9EURY|nr:dTMP kinase [Methanolobus sediminis]WMW26409.1 dTMP kinase [Methanolobus sediminis]
MKGKLITLEGIDGSGKSTITERLRSNPDFKDFVFTREPTTGWIGDAVNRAIHSDTDDLAELLLFTADHAEHISKLILPALESGQNVISDRYSGSRYAYQAVTLKGKFPEPMEWIQQIHRGWTVDPDLTVLFDIDPKISVERCGNRGEQTKFEKIDFLEEVRANYLKLAEAHPERFVIINTDRPVDEIEKDVLEAIFSLVGTR